ncbi:MAG: hydroxysqualene dehydroxylase HpnE [bacterium]|nr:hydroxysqualene dehydroxylase HpnE [bacterium]
MDLARIAVVGGGLAGLAAADELTRAGCEVELFERSRLLGGRATSFEVGGREVDNGQHVFLACCEEFIGFVERAQMGHALRVQERFDVLVLDRDARSSRLRAASLPAPWHLLLSFAGYRHLGWGAKLGIARALAAAAREPRAQTGTFAAWLARHGQDRAAIRCFWEPFFVPALNARLEEMAADEALFVLSTAFLGDPLAARFGFSTVPLAQIAVAAARGLAAVHLWTPVTGLEFDAVGGAVRGVVTPQGMRPFDGVVLALTPPQLERMAGDAERLGLPALREFRARPIIDVHLWHDRGHAGFDFAALIDSPVQWIFEKGAGYLCCSISAATEQIRSSTVELVERAWCEVLRAVPALRGAALQSSAVTRNLEATFAAPPGLRAPGAATTLPNLAIAGSWTATGWPDTMEAAVRSGRAAAGQLLKSEREGERCRVP